jgi:hypothetical protein
MVAGFSIVILEVDAIVLQVLQANAAKEKHCSTLTMEILRLRIIMEDES